MKTVTEDSRGKPLNKKQEETKLKPQTMTGTEATGSRLSP